MYSTPYPRCAAPQVERAAEGEAAGPAGGAAADEDVRGPHATLAVKLQARALPDIAPRAPSVPWLAHRPRARRRRACPARTARGMAGLRAAPRDPSCVSANAAHAPQMLMQI